MSVTIENCTEKVVYVRLNSGTSLGITPGSRSPGVADSEVGGNAKLKKLAEDGLIRVHRSEGDTEPAPSDAARSEGRRAATGTHRRNP